MLHALDDIIATGTIPLSIWAHLLLHPGGYIRTFADKGELMARLLTCLAALPKQRGTVPLLSIHTLLAATEHDKAFKPSDSLSISRRSLPRFSYSLTP